MIKSNIIKVTFNGETKRVQTPANYQELLAATQASFPQAPKSNQQMQFKFFFLDEEQELISISSQDDFEDNCEFIQVTNTTE